MSWLCVRVTTTGTIGGTVDEAFERAGALAVSTTPLDRDAFDATTSLDAPQTHAWKRVCVQGLFAPDADLTELRTDLNGLMDGQAIDVDFLEARDWSKAWRENQKPLHFDGLVVAPMHCTEPFDAEAVVYLDPGLAFGSGTHPTTAACLAWLARHLNDSSSVADIGCGSGILAIAAAKLGADRMTGRVVAVDNDPQAITATRANAEHNAVALHIEHELHEVRGAYDIVLANILAGTLIALAPQLLRILAPHGDLVLSGVLREQAEDVMQAFAPCKFVVENHPGDWVLLHGRCPDQPAGAASR